MTLSQRPFVMTSVYTRLVRGGQLVFLSILWSVAALPVVTAFPATAAMFTVARRWSRGEDPRIARAFWRGFTENFWQAFKIQCIWAPVCYGLVVSFGMANDAPPSLQLVARAMLISASILVAVASIYIFPLMVHYQITTLNMVRLALMLGLGRPATTVLCFLAIALAAFLAILIPPATFISAALAAVAINQHCQVVFAQVASPKQARQRRISGPA